MNTHRIATKGDLPTPGWLEIVNPHVPLGHIRHALFDFDGTISIIRRGWERTMIPLMIEMISGDGSPTQEMQDEVADYVDRSTGILTIKQMEWLAKAVQRYGLSENPRTAREYKRVYNERLLKAIRSRLRDMGQDAQDPEALTIAGSRAFLHDLQERGVRLYLASGTDHVYVVEEAKMVGVTEFFDGRIYGAQDHPDAMTKGQVIARILDGQNLSGEQLLVVGDGPVEIRQAKSRGAVALGVAADEEQRQGIAPRKRQRLLGAGADLIVTSFVHHEALADFLTTTAQS